MTDGFLPLTRQQADALGWGVPDFVYVTGDAYVDHPSFGTAIISRVLDNAGFKVAILAQPDYRSCDSFKKFGKPRLGFLVTGGNIQSEKLMLPAKSTADIKHLFDTMQA